MKLSDLAEGSKITLLIHNNNKRMRMGAVIKKHVKNNVALISLNYATGGSRLVFDNEQISAEYEADGGVPLIWNNVKITSYQSEYVMVVSSEAVKNNRRNSFRVGVSKLARVRSGNGPGQVMIRDISMSGFAVTDRGKTMKLKMGDEMSIVLDDMGHELNLRGKLVRIEEQEEVIIYGFEICNMCRDLSSYVTLKQRKIREAKKAPATGRMAR